MTAIKTGKEHYCIHMAAYFGETDIVEQLIEQGADVNATNEHGRTALHYAFNQNHLKTVGLLAKKGADVNLIEDGDSFRIIYVRRAIEKGRMDMLGLLLDIVGCVNDEDQWGRTRLYYADRDRKIELVKLLLEKGADGHGTNKGFVPVVTCHDCGHVRGCGCCDCRSDCGHVEETCCKCDHVRYCVEVSLEYSTHVYVCKECANYEDW